MITKYLLLMVVFFSLCGFIEADSSEVAEPQITLGRHHVTLSIVNYYSFSVFHIPVYPDENYKGTDEKGFSFGYRYSLSPHLDISCDFWGWVGISGNAIVGEIQPGVGGYGLGLRYTYNEVCEIFNPFLLGNIYYYREIIDIPKLKIRYNKSTPGFGIGSGADFQVSKRLSIPLRIMYHYIKANNNFSGLDFNLGISFNFGK